MKHIQHLGHSLDASCWFTGQLDLSGCFQKARPKLKAKQSMGLGTRGNLNFHPSSSPSGPKDLLCLPYLPPRVRGLSEKMYAEVPGGVGDP